MLFKLFPAQILVTNQMWKRMTQMLGAFKRRTGVRRTPEAGMMAVYVTCVFQRKTIEVKVVFNANGEVTELFF
jgi:hypothetical protein